MKKKIAMLLPNYKGGGMPKVAENISLNLDEDKYDQLLLILSNEKEHRYDFNGEIKHISPSGKNLLSKLYINLKRLPQLKKIKEKEKFDVVISFGVQANIMNIITKSGEITICTEHNIKSIENKTWGFKGKIYDLLMKKYYNKADYLVAISEVMKLDLIKNYNISQDIQVIYNPHVIEEVMRKSKEEVDLEYLDLFNNGPVIITVGRLVYAKAQWALIRVMKKIVDNYPNAKLLILGEGELKDKLIEMAKSLNLQDNIFFLGHVSNPYALIKKSDVFILSSLFEGFPNVLIEALACGTAIISTDCPSGPREILDINKEVNKVITSYEKCHYGVLTPQLSDCIPDIGEKLTDQEEEMYKALKYLLENKLERELYEVRGISYSYTFDVKNKISQYTSLIN